MERLSSLEKFDLAETRWAEILDVARTAPFFFAPWRILLVTGREDSKKQPSDADQKKDLKKKPPDIERQMIREYCQSPAPKTILILVISGKVKKGHPLLKHFESLPAGAADIQEMKPLKGRSLTEWLASTVRASGKVVTPEAQRKLLEIVGSDLRRLENELEKLFTFAADRRVIDADDVAEVCDWGRDIPGVGARQQPGKRRRPASARRPRPTLPGRRAARVRTRGHRRPLSRPPVGPGLAQDRARTGRRSSGP